MCIEAHIRIRQSGQIPLIKLVTVKLLYTFVLERNFKDDREMIEDKLKLREVK